MKKSIYTLIAAILVAGMTIAPAFAGKGSPWAANQGNTWGWQLMTPQERIEHQTKMRSFKTYDECKAYQEEHHKLMETRAKEKGVTLPAWKSGPYGCENMKARGFIK
jgi:hypothetical protein